MMSSAQILPRLRGRGSTHFALLATALLVLLAGCADAPDTPTGTGPRGITLAPRLSLVGPQGAAPSDALNSAFDEVNTFRMVVRRVSDGTVVADVLITVTPGQAEYDLAVDVQLDEPGQAFEVTIIALKDDTVLFESAPVTVVPDSGPQGGPQPVQVALTYSGPGATAASISLSPGTMVLGPGGGGEFVALVLDESGSPISDVPLSWSASQPGVVSVSNTGEVTAGGQGASSVTVTSPNGVTATGWIYVADGEIAFVQGGHVRVGNVSQTTSVDLTPSASAASGPSWAGSGLLYSDGGQIHTTGGGSLDLAGSWPALSPDGSILAVQQGSGIVLANPDGTNPTPGPGGGAPAWAGGGYFLFVGGGSVVRVHADGSDRAVVATGAGDDLPAVSPSGRLAYLSGSGAVMATDASGAGGVALGGGVGAAGRPTWSADETFLVFTGGDGRLHIAVSDGGAPAVPLPLGAGSDPAWSGSGPPGSAPTPLALSEMIPAQPVPGTEVRILGTGFDYLIPANNEVFFPTPEGPEEGEIRKVEKEAITALVPDRVTSGEVRVRTLQGEGTLPFGPGTGSLVVETKTTEGDALEGVEVDIRLDGSSVASGRTDGSGKIQFEGLSAQDHQLHVVSPAGFELLGDHPRTVTPEAGGDVTVTIEFRPRLARVLSDPEKIEVEVGGQIRVRALPQDRNGRPITEFESIEWSAGGSGSAGASGNTLEGTVVGVFPGEGRDKSAVRIALNRTVYTIPATVTSFIQGTLLFEEGAGSPEGASPGRTPVEPDSAQAPQAAGRPATDVTVELWQAETRVATQTTDEGGMYRFSGLFAGEYVVKVPPFGEYTPVPAQHAFPLGPGTPSGMGDFLISQGTVVSVDIDPDSRNFVALGDTHTFSYTARDQDERIIGGRVTTWSSSDPSVATVDANGKVTAVSNGTADITVTVDGVTDTATVTVNQVAVTVEIFLPDGQARTIIGDTGHLEVDARDANGHSIPDPAVTWSVVGPPLITIDTSGNASADAVGTTDIQAEVDGVTDTRTVTILDSCPGPLTINNAADVAAFQASLCGEIEGSVDISSSTLTDLYGMENLLRVTGSLDIKWNSYLTDIGGILYLREVGGSLEIRYNPLLSGAAPAEAPAPVDLFEAPSRSPEAIVPPILPPPGVFHLLEVGGDLEIEENPSLTSLDFLAGLQFVWGGLYIAYMDGLTSLDGLQNLQEVGGLGLEFNPNLISSGAFPNLYYVDWGIWLDDPAIAIGFPGLLTVMGTVDIGYGYFYGETPPQPVSGPRRDYGPSFFLDATFPMLECVDGPIFVTDNESLETLDFPNLERMSSCYAVIEPSGQLTGAQREARRREIGSSERFSAFQERTAGKAESWARARQEREGSPTRAQRAPSGARIGDGSRSPTGPMLNGYGGCNSLGVAYNPALWELNLPDLRTVDGDLYLSEGNDALVSVPLPSLEYVGGLLEIFDSRLTFFSAPLLVEVGEIEISFNEILAGASFPSLETVFGGGYDSPPAPAAPRAGERPKRAYSGYGDVNLEENDVLTTFDLSNLSEVDYLGVSSNPLLTTLPPLPNLPSWVEIWIGDNPNLTSLAGLAGVTEVGDLDLANNGLLSLTGLASLQTVEGRLSIDGEPNLPTASLPALVNADYLDFESNGSLTSISAPLLEQVGGINDTSGWLVFRTNALLNSVGFPSLHTVVGDLKVEDNANLPNLDGFSTLIGDLINLRIAENASLTDISGLLGLGGHDGTDPIFHGDFEVTDNYLLGDANVVTFLTTLDTDPAKGDPAPGTAVAGTTTILNNDPPGS